MLPPAKAKNTPRPAATAAEVLGNLSCSFFGINTEAIASAPNKPPKPNAPFDMAYPVIVDSATGIVESIY
jgi:hypothetical protein